MAVCPKELVNGGVSVSSFEDFSVQLDLMRERGREKRTYSFFPSEGHVIFKFLKKLSKLIAH